MPGQVNCPSKIYLHTSVNPFLNFINSSRKILLVDAIIILASQFSGIHWRVVPRFSCHQATLPETRRVTGRLVLLVSASVLGSRRVTRTPYAAAISLIRLHASHSHVISISFLRLFVRAWAIHLSRQEGSNACLFWRSKIKYTNQPADDADGVLSLPRVELGRRAQL